MPITLSCNCGSKQRARNFPGKKVRCSSCGAVLTIPNPVNARENLQQKEEWFISRDRKSNLGPYSWEKLRELATHGEISPTDMVWKSGMENWVVASEVQGIFKVAAGPPPIPSLLLLRASAAFAPVGFLARLGLSGNLLVFGGLAGIVTCFLPVLSISIEPVLGPRETKTIQAIDDWRGVICLIGYFALVVIAILLYPASGFPNKNLCGVAIGIGMLVFLLAVWLLIVAYNSVKAMQVGLESAFESFAFLAGRDPVRAILELLRAAALVAEVKVNLGIGAFLSLLTGACVTLGAILKSKREKLL